MQDSKVIWEWRNNSHTREMSIDSNFVNWDDHEVWFEKSLNNKNRFLYVGSHLEFKGILVGMSRFDFNEHSNSAEVSINLNPDMRNKGLSAPLLLASIEEFKKYKKSLLTATVKKENLASIKCFEKCGFQLVRQDEVFNFYRHS